MSDPATSPPLETGWLPDTPIGDSYLRRFLWNWADACAANARFLGGFVLDSDSVRLADAARPGSFSNCATLTQPLTAESADATLARITNFFAFDDPSRLGEVLLVSAWPTGDLRPHGWSLMGHPPVHLLPQGVPARPAPLDLRIETGARHAWRQSQRRERFIVARGIDRRRNAGAFVEPRRRRGRRLRECKAFRCDGL